MRNCRATGGSDDSTAEARRSFERGGDARGDVRGDR